MVRIGKESYQLLTYLIFASFLFVLFSEALGSSYGVSVSFRNLLFYFDESLN